MRMIIDYYSSHDENCSLTSDALYLRGAIPRNIDKDRVVSVLKDMGYIKTTWSPGIDGTILVLTPEGNTYFERRSDLSRKELWSWIRYVITTIIAIVALIISLLK